MKKIAYLTVLTVLFALLPQLQAATPVPTLTIVAPKTGVKLSNDTVVVAATVKSTVSIAHVLYSVNGGSWSDANQSNTTWRATANLVAGTNTISMYAVTTSSESSKTNEVKVNDIVTSPFTVTIIGDGTLKPDLNNENLAISNGYSMKATADKGFAFYFWGGGVPMNTNPTLTFLMVPGLSITANFRDVTAPTVGITSPATGLRVSNATLTVSGKSGDNVAVTNVYLSVDEGDWMPTTLSNNGSNWTTQVNLNAGTNTISAVAVDSSGNISKTNTVKVVYVVNTTTLVGTWNVIQYKTPALLSNDAGGNLLDGDNFAVGTGIFTFDTNGDVSGVVGESFTGTYVENNDGSVVLSITNSDNPSGEELTFYVNAAKDTMDLVQTSLNDENDNQELVTAVRMPAALTLASVAGTYNVAEFRTPVQITGGTNGLQGGSQFDVTNGTLTLNSNGTFTGKVKNTLSGTFVIGDSGTIIITSSTSDVLTFYVNFNQDTLIEVSSQLDSNDNEQELNVCHRIPATTVKVAALAGTWNMVQYHTPAVVTDDAINGVVGGNSFDVTNGVLNIQSNGSINGTLQDAFTGTVSVGAKGMITANIIPTGQSAQTFTFYLNAGLDTMTEVTSVDNGNDNHQELVIAHRVPAN